MENVTFTFSPDHQSVHYQNKAHFCINSKVSPPLLVTTVYNQSGCIAAHAPIVLYCTVRVSECVPVCAPTCCFEAIISYTHPLVHCHSESPHFSAFGLYCTAHGQQYIIRIAVYCYVVCFSYTMRQTHVHTYVCALSTAPLHPTSVLASSTAPLEARLANTSPVFCRRRSTSLSSRAVDGKQACTLPLCLTVPLCSQ